MEGPISRGKSRRLLLGRRPKIAGVLFVLVAMLMALMPAALAGGTRRHLETVGWSNLGNPPGLHSEIVVLGDVVVMGSLFGSSKVRISDVSDPSNPTLIGELDLVAFGDPFDVKTNADYARCPLDGSNSFGEGTADAACSLVLASTQGGSIGAHLIDITTPSSPVLLSSINLTGISGGGSHNSFLWGDWAFVGGLGGGHGVRIYDVSNPATPVFATEYAAAGFFVHDLFVQEDGGRVLMYLANIGQGLEIVDVTVPANPQQVAFDDYNTELGITQDFVAHYVEPTNDGNWTFMGDETECGDPGGIRVFDTSGLPAAGDPAVDVEQVAEFTPVPFTKMCANDVSGRGPVLNHAYWNTGHNFDILGDRLYQGDYHRGVNVFDISDPTKPTLIANARLHRGVGEDQRGDPGQEILVSYPFVWQAVSDGQYIYASDTSTGLYVLQLVENP